jgi:antitoxin component YwqK of YwqJK toxin-antitoxin module
MNYSKLSNKSFTAIMKHLLVMAFAILTIGCGEKKSDGVNLDELEDREGVFYLKNSNSPYTGKCFEFHDNGQKKSETTLKDGEYDGLSLELHENGQKETEGNYKDGKLDGPLVIWHENGQKKLEVNYKDGKEDGPLVMWHENGQKMGEVNYKDGELDGLTVSWHENGQNRTEINYKDGTLISSKYWNSKGEEVDSIEEAKQ